MKKCQQHKLGPIQTEEIHFKVTRLSTLGWYAAT